MNNLSFVKPVQPTVTLLQTVQSDTWAPLSRPWIFSNGNHNDQKC